MAKRKPKISADKHKQLKQLFQTMEADRRPMWPMWRELAAMYLPYTHPWLLNKQKNEKVQLNPYYATSAGLKALRTQTAGLMNGITSPTRPWFKLQIGPDNSRLSIAARKWLHACEQVMYSVMARSNYYSVKAMSYFDLGLMNISGSQIFTDQPEVIRVQRFNTGEFYVAFDSRGRVIRYGRRFYMALEDAKNEFGEENLPTNWQEQLKNRNSWRSQRMIWHMVQVKTGEPVGHPSDRFAWQEFYWTTEAAEGDLLKIAGYHEQPATFPRWSAELEYGAAPAMDALADMRELVQLLLSKGTGLEKMIDPPMLYDRALQNQPTSTMPGGHAFVANLGELTGARPAYQLNLPIQELRADIQEILGSIRELFHNDLFKMISQLETVRSATEIDARREEKLVLLSHFLERHENESLDPDINRIFAICQRADLFPDPPRDIVNADVDVTYVSILAQAQRAISTVPLERLMAMVGQVAAVEPAVLDIVNFDEFTYTYGRNIGADPTVLRDEQQLMARRQQREQQLAAQAASATAATAVDAGKTLSETDVGGGANALQRLLA